MPYKPRGPIAVLVAACALAAPAIASADARDVARDYLNAHPDKFGVTSADVADVFVMSSYTTSGTGVTHVNVNQRHQGLEVFGGHATINVGPDGRVIFTGGRLVPLGNGGSAVPNVEPGQAVESAARALKLGAPKLRVLSRDATKARKTVFSGGGISNAPIDARLGWWPENGDVRLAWQSVIDDTDDAHLWSTTVDAKTGALLNVDDWTSHDDVKELGQRLDREDAAAHRTPAFQQPFAAVSPPNPVLDGSAYRVFAWPNESPNDAGRTLVANPADSVASPRGWHDIDNSAGADFTTTQGNNVNAYMDQDSNNAPDYRSAPSGGSSLRFDFPLDLTQHAQASRDAAVANLFYSNNMIHDVLYRYGFDDVSGNFQENNYNRGGTGGDPVQAEAADGSGTNNANFSTPAADGGKPRMQMYLWPGNQLGPQNQVVIEGGATYGASWARFTPPATPAGLPGRTLVYGGTGCSESTYPASRPGENWIAVVDGGTMPCTYLRRVEVAQSLNADAVIVVDTGTGQTPPILTGLMTDAPVVIPAVAVNAADGTAIKALIQAGPAPKADLRKNPDRAPIRDGDIDNGIVIHEYGHGVSNRLTGGPKTSNCLSGNEQAGEGWSDFFAITFLLDPRLDNPEGTRGLVPYALFQADRSQAGLRPRPYSRNMDTQPFTYDSIKTNGWLNGTSLALPHGLGHGWAAVLWDMTWDLIDKHGFNPNLYGAWNTGGNNRSIQYVVDGLKLQGCFPGLVVSRDAIIAGAEARNPGVDTCTIWATFARRGFGYSAVQGTTNRDDNTEAFDTHPDCRRNFQAPVLPEPAVNDRPAGSIVDLRFTADGYRGLDVLAENQPYSRLVDCTTLKPVTPGQTAITPRPTPKQAMGTLSVNDRGIFSFPWQTEAGWAGTCREMVATADTGRQYRAFFRFT